MSPSYRLGSRIVLGTVLGSLIVCLILPPLLAGRNRAAHDVNLPLGRFELRERSDKKVTDADLADRVWISAFIFTRCPLSCPRISGVMKGLQTKLAGLNVKLVSLTVDPDNDTPAVLSAYADHFGADPDRWWFLTGPKGDVLTLIRDRFKLGVEVNTDAPSVSEGRAEAFSHSERLALVDHGRVVGIYAATEPREINDLVARARQLGAPPWVKRLPAVNATLNGTCAVLLLLGWFLIRSGNWRGHAATMIACVTVSALFLTCYLVYHYEVGSVPYRGLGPTRLAYFTILLSHTLLATFGVVPLVGLTLYRATRRQFDRHSRIASVTFPIWLYVSVTGVVIYMMLYQLPLASP